MWRSVQRQKREATPQCYTSHTRHLLHIVSREYELYCCFESRWRYSWHWCAGFILPPKHYPRSVLQNMHDLLFTYDYSVVDEEVTCWYRECALDFRRYEVGKSTCCVSGSHIIPQFWLNCGGLDSTNFWEPHFDRWYSRLGLVDS